MTSDMQNFIRNGIIGAQDLLRLLSSGDPRIKLLDATYALTGDAPQKGYRARRIGGAAFLDIESVSDKTSLLPHMLPPASQFESAIGTLGISNQDFIVVYSQEGMVMGPPRAWWMFRVFGHDAVCVLDGGLPEWVRAGYPVNTNPPVKPSPGMFKASYRPELLRTVADMQEASAAGSALILDARAAPRFSGAAPEPRPGLRCGHMPGARNVPAADLVDAGTGRLKPDADLRRIVEDAGYSPAKPVYATCGSGITACMIALALYKIGHSGVSVYDGSWAEWGQSNCNTPVSA